MALRFSRLRLCLALALISAAVIAYQLALMQILSLVQWHHFAYLIIAVALLGFGAAGTLLSLFRERLMANFAPVLPLVLCLSGAAMTGLLWLFPPPALPALVALSDPDREAPDASTEPRSTGFIPPASRFEIWGA